MVIPTVDEEEARLLEPAAVGLKFCVAFATVLPMMPPLLPDDVLTAETLLLLLRVMAAAVLKAAPDELELCVMFATLAVIPTADEEEVIVLKAAVEEMKLSVTLATLAVVPTTNEEEAPFVVLDVLGSSFAPRMALLRDTAPKVPFI